MINARFKPFYFFICIFIAVMIAPPSHGSVSDQSLVKILMLSGLTDQIEQFPELIKLGMQEMKDQGSTLSDSAYALVIASIDQTILPSEINSTVKDALRDDLSKKDAKQLLKWYESDLGKKITYVEASNSSADAYNKMLASEAELLANTDRLAFAKRFDELLGATDMNIELQKHSSVAIFSALMTAAQPDKVVDISPFIDQIDALSEQSRAIVEKDVILSFIYAYQDIKMNNLEQYETFLNETSTKKFNNIVRKSMSVAIEKSISKWATSLASIFQHKGAKAL